MMPEDMALTPPTQDHNARGRNDWFRARRLNVAGIPRHITTPQVQITAYSDRGAQPNFAPLFLTLTPADARALANRLLIEADYAEAEATPDQIAYGRHGAGRPTEEVTA